MASSEVDIDEIPRILSVQSHVVSGHVGNDAAVFPLQLLGFEVDTINSVQFSNHTGYAVVRGTVIGGKELEELGDGLEGNGLLNYEYLLTGYIGSETFLRSIVRLFERIRVHNDKLRYICDPVLGDGGRYYVPKELVSIFRDELLKRAYMVTPNQFEAELLSGIDIVDEESALSAMVRLAALGPEVRCDHELEAFANLSGYFVSQTSQVICLTSAEFSSRPGVLQCYMMTCDRRNGNARVSRIIVPKLGSYGYTGTGDLMAALLLAWTHRLKQQDNVTVAHLDGFAFRNALATVQAVIARSHRRVEILVRSVQKTESALMTAALELPIVQSKRDIECPSSEGLEMHSWTIRLSS